MGELRKYTFDGFIANDTSRGCVSDFKYEIDLPFVLVFSNPHIIYLQPHSSSEVKAYTNVIIKATSISFPDVVLVSNNFTIEVTSTEYPYFQNSIEPLNLKRGVVAYY